jgi:hypothetical protein
VSEITSRPLEVMDLPMLQRALDQDKFEHFEAADYTRDSAFSKVYQDEQGPIGVLRYTKTLRLVTVWCDNSDSRRNAASIIQAIKDSVELAKANGYTEIIFKTQSHKLANFCVENLGFVESQGEYIKEV